MNARCINRLLDIHPVIHHIYKCIDHNGDDARTARTAQHHDSLAIFGHDRRAHRTQWSLSGCNHIGLALHQSKQVGNAGLSGKIIHLVVQEKTSVACNDARTEKTIDRIGN